MNKIFLIGNTTKDPELASTSSGISVCEFFDCGKAFSYRFRRGTKNGFLSLCGMEKNRRSHCGLRP